MDPTFPLVPIANLLAFLLVLVPLISNLLQSWNTGVCMYAIWVGTMALIRGINTIVWADNSRNLAPVWCDITTHLDIGSYVAIPACSLTITRRLYKITRLREIVPGTNKVRNEILVDLSICLGIPILIMALYYIWQPQRYEILEEIGCLNTVVQAGLTVIIMGLCGTLLPLISVLFYCPRIIWVFYHQRKELNEFLDSGRVNSINRNSYFRIMALGCLDAIFTLPLNILDVVLNSLDFPVDFWPGWRAVHADWGTIGQFTTADWKSGGFWSVFAVRWDEWINVLFAIVFFALFGLTAEARMRYCRAFWSVARRLGFKRPTRAKIDISDVMFGSFQVNPTDSRTTTQESDTESVHVASGASHTTHEKIHAGPIDVEKGISVLWNHDGTLSSSGAYDTATQLHSELKEEVP